MSRAASGSRAGSYVGVGGTEADVEGFDLEGRAETMNCSFRATFLSATKLSASEPAHDEFDDGIVEPFILLVPRGLYHFEKMVNKTVIELSQFLLIQLLNPTDFIH